MPTPKIPGNRINKDLIAKAIDAINQRKSQQSNVDFKPPEKIKETPFWQTEFFWLCVSIGATMIVIPRWLAHREARLEKMQGMLDYKAEQLRLRKELRESDEYLAKLSEFEAQRRARLFLTGVKEENIPTYVKEMNVYGNTHNPIWRPDVIRSGFANMEKPKEGKGIL